jgi:hypothetical protein
MAVHYRDELSDALGITNAPNEREAIFLWLFLRGIGEALNPDLYGSRADTNQMAQALNSNSQIKEQARGLLASHLLPEQTLSWIARDDHQLKWIESALAKRYGIHPTNLPPQLERRQRSIALIDSWMIGPVDKRQHLSRLEEDWNTLRRQDNLFKWFNGAERLKRCTVAWEWLCDNKSFHTYGKTPFSDYGDLLLFFDQTDWSEADKTICVLGIKRRWSQKSYRERLKDKKQYNFVLTDDTNKKLNALAAKHNLKRNEILEALIKIESTQDLYISEFLGSRTSLL